MTSPDPEVLAAAITRATDDLRPLLGIDDPEVNKAREQTEAMIAAAKAYQPMREALEETLPRYIELFEAAGLGAAEDSIAVQIMRKALGEEADV